MFWSHVQGEAVMIFQINMLMEIGLVKKKPGQRILFWALRCLVLLQIITSLVIPLCFRAGLLQ